MPNERMTVRDVLAKMDAEGGLGGYVAWQGPMLPPLTPSEGITRKDIQKLYTLYQAAAGNIAALEMHLGILETKLQEHEETSS